MRLVLVLLAVLSAACGVEGGPRATDAPAPRTAAATTTPPPAATTVRTPEATRAVSTANPDAPPGCRNSTSAACGAFRFDPEPSDDEVTVRATASSAQPKAGDTVTFTLRASDPDSPLLSLGTYEFGPRGSAHIARQEASSCPRGFGPWDPPKAASGTKTQTLRYTYREAGTFEATFTFTSRSAGGRLPGDEDGRCIDPYRSSGKADVTIRVS